VIEQVEGGLYFDVDGTRYRVHDACFGPPLAAPGRFKVVPLESPQANTRYFVDVFEVVRAYSFRRTESRAITEAALIQQLHASGFTGTSRRTQGVRRPT
jgi:hypothetical protein